MRTIHYILLLAVLFLGIFSGDKVYRWHDYSQKSLKVPLLEKEFVGMEGLEESPMFIALSLHKDPVGLKRTLQSIRCQEYKNIQVMILGVNPSEAQQAIVNEFRENAKFPVLQEYGAAPELQKKLHASIEALDKEALVIPLDTQHYLSNSFVLKTLNINKFSTGKRLFFGQYIHYPSYEQGVQNKKVKSQIKKQKFPADQSFLGTFKAFAPELLSSKLDIFALDKHKILLSFYNMHRNKAIFCPHVMWMVNDLPLGEEVIFDGAQTL